MKVLEWYFGFHAPASLRDLRAGASLRTIFGHVEAWGYTADDTWIFFDPRGAGTRILITHLHDEVEDQMVARLETCQLILKIAPDDRQLRVPLHLGMNCASQCAHLVGRRAFGPGGLRRMLLKNGAEIIHDTERRPGGKG
ncbi:hypothetical protein KM176_16520 [Pseudooceanicola sp. CBS1P-1]|uniref:Uncharacterized protein n=1 Tax=Pseudooceanicola albus TaxID=2692189 RepID=A0A6L7G6G3_9RHOB|nr:MULTISPECIES: hypothetical protein [Pseudooceanicola]MBT9385480.1 hypothetical protein [Pseudooceanicola endophyticus]MXN19108.1 hypothetical protein [Pseudooceanicola albus]